MKVKKVFDKRLGVELSELGFGAMRLPTLENGKIDWEQSSKMVDMAYEAGVNYFDTAVPYHGGESQVFLGETLKKYPRESYHYVTKLPVWAIKSKEQMDEIFNQQFVDCRMDYFDFYMIHGLGEDRNMLIEQYEIYKYLLEQKKAGRIKFLGFSYHGNYEAFKFLFDNYKWDFAMIQYNYADDMLMKMNAYYDLMAERDVPCIAMEPIRGGYLANPPQAALDEMQKFEGEKYSPAGWALRWSRDRQHVLVTLSGMSSIAQVEQNIRIFTQAPEKLTEAEHAMLARARDIMLEIKTVPCTYCGYCMDCPAGVNIPRVFEVYNQYKLFPNQFRAGVNYGKLVRDGKGFPNCIECGICSPLCPQDIDIPARLRELDAEIEPLRQKFIASI
ncbi:MAG: aldo/keto reductase [Defluviitaleaceae bacterium]|nr:aldo/keto reductase [Defluviitaleaceae bacterium]